MNIVEQKIRNSIGQYADEMINGGTCSHCGTMLAEEHGFPVLCASEN